MMPGFGWNGCCGFGSLGNLGWIGWIINLVLTLGILIGLVILIIWVIRKITNSQNGSIFSSSQGERGITTAQDLIKIRYARGEISREEFHQMLEDLQ